MAATIVSNINQDWPVTEAYEVFTVTTGSATSIVITPTVIGAIHWYTIEPLNAAGATAATSTYTNWTFGCASFTITAPATACVFQVVVRGTRQ